MKTIGVIGITGLLAVAAMVADDKMRAAAETNDQDAPVVDTNGNLRVPDDYRRPTRLWAHGPWRLSRVRAPAAPYRLCFARHDRRLS